jgi:hypothetical protein
VYCSRYLPEFIKKLNSYQEGRLNDALIESFLKFDAVLLDANVKKILQKLANDENEEPDQEQECVTSLNPDEENCHNDELNAEETELLKKEAELPIAELLKRYNGDEKHFHSPNITKRILDNTDETIKNAEIDPDSHLKSDDATDQKTEVRCFFLSNVCFIGSFGFI